MNIGRKIRGLGLLVMAFAATLGLVACGGGSSSNDQTTMMGAVRFALTDAPSCGFDQINITITRVRVNTSPTADDNSSGWRDLPITPARRMNLLDLTNGVLEELGQMPLPAGQYTQVRLVLQANTGGSPANSVVPTGGGTEVPLDTPSAAQSGLKLIHAFNVPAGGLADLVLDFDACKSIVRRGNGTFGLKPVISVSTRAVAEIVGNVDPTLTGVTVSAQAGGAVMRATVPDATGAFRLAFLDPAAAPSVDVVLVAPDRTTAVVAGVPIALQGTTRISTSAAPIQLPTSTTRTVSGTAMPVVAAASLRAVQMVGVVPTIEVASTNADAVAAYSMTLPTAAPLLAPYSTTLPLVFAAQSANAAKYSVEAAAAGYATQSSAIDLSTTNATVNFTLVPTP
jgi:hypothetical protein